MKFSFNFKKQEVALHADVENIITKQLDKKAERPPKKTRYQIRQEEKRRNRETELKHALIWMAVLFGMVVFFIIISFIGASI